MPRSAVSTMPSLLMSAGAAVVNVNAPDVETVEPAIASGTAVRLAGAAIVIDGGGGEFARAFGAGLPAGAALPRVGITDDVMHVVAETPDDALAATEALLRVLDERYFWPGYMHGLVPNTAVGVLGRYIGDDGHFHGTPPEGLP